MNSSSIEDSKELLKMLVESIVDEPDEVSIDVVDGEISDILQLKVAPDDMGKVIGKRGRIAYALRTIIRAHATKEGTRVNVEIVE